MGPELKIEFNKEAAVWQLVEIKTSEVLDTDIDLKELTDNYPKAILILPRGN